ncbi:MAG: 30S ribosomal protein S19 [Candidatus Altiarchaeales archaeon HGW-Altiarchaeales-1]|nr:ribosomal protein S19 [uncultured archaeon]PKP58357.1 MAG: 30S ribosomal protein S19 [Candidatus Altiarchaeales archaeon HGW-Altiarchaeales-2]PKP60777.1 MAG: 30S ribosomal protein S19 [Candidatus Altiarchaeales archaeon HGW-Altiarchaeales-1]
MARIFNYRGKTTDQLKALSMDELAKVMPARIRRVLNRGLDEPRRKLLLKIRKTLTTNKNKVIKTHSRDMPILPEMVGAKVAVYRGGKDSVNTAFIPVEITSEMIGHYLGEFVMTRKTVKHSAAGLGATRGSKFTSLRK